MAGLVVSQTNPRAFRTIADALAAAGQSGSHEHHIIVEPGNYRQSAGCTYRGNAVITAAGGTGTVTVDSSGEPILRVEGRVTLRGLVLRNWNDRADVLQVVGGTLEVERCEVTTKSTIAINAWGGAALFVRDSRVNDGAIVYSDSAGVVERTDVLNADQCGIALHSACRVTVRDSRIKDAGEHGIWATKGALPLIERCEVTNSRAASVLIQDRAEAAVHDSRFHGSGQCGFVVRENASARVRDSSVVGSRADGVWITAGGSVEMSAVRVTDGRRHGAVIDEHSKARFQDCDITGNAQAGFCVNSSASVEFAGGSIVGGASGVSVGADAHREPDRTKDADSKSVAVAADPGAHIVVRGCTVTGHGASGLVFTEGSDTRVEDTESGENGFRDLIDLNLETLTDASSADAATSAPAPAAAPEPAAPAGDTGEATDARGADELLAELDAMVGLAEVKHEIKKITKLLRVAEQRRQAGLPPGPAIGRHVVFSGAPGTGKTTVARLYGHLLAALGTVSTGQFTEVSRADLVGRHLGETTQKTTEVFTRARGGVLFIDEAYTLSRRFGVGSDFGQEAIDALVKLMEDFREEVVVVFAGYSTEMREFLTANPGLKSRVSRTIEFENYRPAELALITRNLAERYGYRLDEQAADSVLTHFQHARRDESFGNGREARRIFEAALEQQALRLADLNRIPTAEELTLLLPVDFDGVVDAGLRARFGDSRDTGHLQVVLDRLNAMPGLAGVKDQIRDTLDLITAGRRRREAGLATDVIAGHLVFSGPPGTGKTTVARLYGELLAALGVLARGQVVEVSRADLVGQHLGETGQKTATKFNEARGGVLFIDEVYALARRFGTNQDFGQEAIDTLVKLMEDHRDEVVVIVAGYTEELADFLAANPGLASRFSRTIAFTPYDQDEMLAILGHMADAAGFEIPPGTLTAVSGHLAADAETFAQGNGREVRKLLEIMRTSHARRIAQIERDGGLPAQDDLRILRPEDVPRTT